LDPAGLDRQLGIAQLAAAHGNALRFDRCDWVWLWSCWPVNVARPPVGPDAGCLFVVFHLSVSKFMQLALFSQLLVLIYIVSPIYWMILAIQSVARFFAHRAQLTAYLTQ